MSAFVPVSWYFDYYSFVICFEIRKCAASSFVLLSQDFLAIWDFLRCYVYFMNFFLSTKNAIEILMGILSNLYMGLGSMDVLTILSLPIHEHGISYHLFMSSLIFFITVL